MKLIDKTRRTYIIYSILIFVISSTVIYFTLTEIFRNEQDEKLLWDKELIAAKIKYDYPLPIFEVDDFPARVKLKDTLYFKDTIIYQVINGVEKHEAYRQLTSVETLHNRTYRIVTRSSNVRNRDFILIITTSVGVVVLLLIATIFFINTNLMGSVWKPFYKNLESLKRFSVEENKPIHLQESNIDEFQELNESLSKLTNKINSDFNNLKEFTENASHEMQTPLAIMQTKSEILLQSENLNKDQVQHIKAIYQSVQRLSKLNKTLLLLSKIENNQFPETEKVRVKEAIDRHLEIYEDFIENKNLQATNECAEELEIEVNPLLFDMVLSNLISNAIKHNEEGGMINVVANKLSLSVTNTGNPLKLSSSSLFERFKKDSKSSNSFGLGLAIVKKVCDNYQWKITHSYLEEKHTISIYF